jgi:GNAT superfamily N-acetyltransferase
VREDELAGWLDVSKRQYAADIAENAGLTREEADRKAEHSLFVLEDAGADEPVGRAWLGERDGPDGRAAYVWDVFVEEQARGRGFGRRAMELLEKEARRRGHTRIRLNVFGGNEVARSLYRSLGYAELAVFMGKDLQ